MRVLYKESAVALSAVQGEIDSAYGLSNMQDEYPRHAFISNSAIETINVSWLNTPDTIFLGHVMAEEIVFNFNTGDVITIPNYVRHARS